MSGLTCSKTSRHLEILTCHKYLGNSITILGAFLVTVFVHTCIAFPNSKGDFPYNKNNLIVIFPGEEM